MQDSLIYIGLISGTSVDGIDVAAVRFSNQQNLIDVVDTLSFPIPEDIKTSLIALNQNSDSELHQMMSLDIKMGELFSQAVLALLKQNKINPKEVAAIGSHGQTIRHQITEAPFYTVQIGNANIIAERTGITTVCDFRMRDMIVGGQGAPLVPAFHEYLFKNDDSRIILNLGGMANLTFLWNDKTTEGFDTGPANVLMDAWIKQSKNLSYDEHGEWAQSGKPIPKLLDSFLKDPYFTKEPPKSTGREHFDIHWLNQHLDSCQLPNPKAEDVQASLLQLSCETIALAIENWGPKACELLVCGGGAHNDFFLNALQTRLPTHQVASTESAGLKPDWVEACAFAWLAKRCLENKTGNVQSVTGASKAVVLGGIYPAGN